MPLAIVMFVSLLLVIAAALYSTAKLILRPPRMTDGKALHVLHRLGPDDLDMAFEKRSYEVRDEATNKSLRIVGWWIPYPASSDRTVVLVHGYADAKVGAIAWAPTWQRLGYHILAIDSRAHGESGGKYQTAGFFERHDLDQVLNQLRAASPSQTRKIVLFGVSLGGVTTLATAALRNDISAIVLESPIRHFRNGVAGHLQLLQLPLKKLLPVVMKVASWISGADLDQIQPLELMRNATCPIFAIQSGDDPFCPPADAEEIRAIVEQRNDGSRCWRVDEAWHLMALAVDPEIYFQKLEEFLQRLPDA